MRSDDPKYNVITMNAQSVLLGIVLLLGGCGGTQEQDDIVARTRKAAEQGHADAQNNLGLMYANGEGVPFFATGHGCVA